LNNGVHTIIYSLALTVWILAGGHEFDEAAGETVELDLHGGEPHLHAALSDFFTMGATRRQPKDAPSPAIGNADEKTPEAG